ncbi:MAG: RDD family protein [Sporichthyaceae bacterium]
MWNHRNANAALSGVTFVLPYPPSVVADAIARAHNQGALAAIQRFVRGMTVTPLGPTAFGVKTKIGDQGTISISQDPAGSLVTARALSLYVGSHPKTHNWRGSAIAHHLSVWLGLRPSAARFKRWQSGLESRIKKALARVSPPLPSGASPGPVPPASGASPLTGSGPTAGSLGSYTGSEESTSPPPASTSGSQSGWRDGVPPPGGSSPPVPPPGGSPPPVPPPGGSPPRVPPPGGSYPGGLPPAGASPDGFPPSGVGPVPTSGSPTVSPLPPAPTFVGGSQGNGPEVQGAEARNSQRLIAIGVDLIAVFIAVAVLANLISGMFSAVGFDGNDIGQLGAFPQILALPFAFLAVSTLLPCLHEVTSSVPSATLGQVVAGVRVVDASTRLPLTIGQSARRVGVRIVDIPFLVEFLTGSKGARTTAMHDRATGTAMVEVGPIGGLLTARVAKLGGTALAVCLVFVLALPALANIGSLTGGGGTDDADVVALPLDTPSQDLPEAIAPAEAIAPPEVLAPAEPTTPPETPTPSASSTSSSSPADTSASTAPLPLGPNDPIDSEGVQTDDLSADQVLSLSDDDASQRLQSYVDEGEGAVDAISDGTWVPQVSSKCAGLLAADLMGSEATYGYPDGEPESYSDGITVQQILAFHRGLRDRFDAYDVVLSTPGQLGIQTTSAGACGGNQQWISLVTDVQSSDFAEVNSWCDDRDLPVDECGAREVDLGGESDYRSRSAELD